MKIIASPPKKPASIPREAIVAFTDGSDNKQGCGYTVVFPDYLTFTESKEYIDQKMTSNRAEYMAAIRAMQIASQIDSTKGKELVIYTDSQLLERSLNVMD